MTDAPDPVEASEAPQIYLITPPEFELSSFPATLSRIMDSVEIACVRLSLAAQDEDDVGADYVAMGPLSDTGLGAGALATAEDFEWWSQMIELPIVAEGGIDIAMVEAFAPFADFFAIGAEIWKAEDPLTALKALVAPLG
jgi:thiamine monophosphate synthase